MPTTIEHLEPRVYLSLTMADCMVLCPYIVPGDRDGDNVVGLDDFVDLKQAGPDDVLEHFEAMKLHWGDPFGIPITANPVGAGTYTELGAPLFVDEQTADDWRQGNVGDCYGIAAAASVVHADPWFFSRTMADLGDGTFIGHWVYVSGEITVFRMTTDLLVNSSGGLIYATLTPDGESYAALWEKMFAEARYGAGSYASIDRGWPDGVYRGLGLDSYSDWVWNYTDLPSHLESVLANGGAVTLVSQTTNVGPIVANHVYAVTDVIRDPAGEIVGIELYNPWGNYLSITIPQLLAGFRLVTEVAT